MSSILQKQIGIAAAPVTLTTNAETLVAYTGRCEANLPTLRAVIRAWAKALTGASATGIQPRIRRGNGITGTILAAGTPITMTAAQGLDTTLVFAESLQNVEYADYSLTIQQIGATADGTVGLAAIEVEMING